MRRAERIFVLSAALALAGCGAEFDPPSRVKTLRVLAVQKDHPYAKPGEVVQMSMLWHDGSKKAPRQVTIAWLAACYDPPGDLYQGCFQSLAGVDPSSGVMPPDAAAGLGDRFQFTMPKDVISRRPPPADPRQPPYGLAYVFFAVCAGTLGPAPAGSDGPTFPIACYDEKHQPLGGDDFVAGYSAVYAFDDYRNENPIVNPKFTVGSLEYDASCVGDACLDTPVEDTFECDKKPCVALCEADGTKDCPEVHIKPSIDRASAEVDQISVDAYGETFEEQMWVNYYVTAGGVKSEARLLNDATAGWNGDYGTEFYAPRTPGVISIWAVAHDNRGGVNWARRDVMIR